MDDGWIKIHKSIWRNPWMYRPNVLAVWLYILSHVEWRPSDVVFEGKRITLQPGQGLFKLLGIAQEMRISKSGLYRIIDVLKTEKQIETQTSPRNTLITVVNWRKYQLVGKQNETQMGNKRETNGKQTGNLPIIKEKEEREEANTREQTYFPDEVNEAERYLKENIVLLVIPDKHEIQPVVSRYGLDAFKRGVQIMARRGGRTLKYLETILSDPKTMGATGGGSVLTEEDIYEILK